jgi:hypothetical protein
MRLNERKSRLTFVTTDEVRYKSKYRAVVVEVDRSGFGGTVRLEGTRARFAFSFAGLYNHAVQVQVSRERSEKRAKAKAKKVGQ